MIAEPRYSVLAFPPRPERPSPVRLIHFLQTYRRFEAPGSVCTFQQLDWIFVKSDRGNWYRLDVGRFVRDLDDSDFSFLMSNVYIESSAMSYSLLFKKRRDFADVYYDPRTFSTRKERRNWWIMAIRNVDMVMIARWCRENLTHRYHPVIDSVGFGNRIFVEDASDGAALRMFFGATIDREPIEAVS